MLSKQPESTKSKATSVWHRPRQLDDQITIVLAVPHVEH